MKIFSLLLWAAYSEDPATLPNDNAVDMFRWVHPLEKDERYYLNDKEVWNEKFDSKRMHKFLGIPMVFKEVSVEDPEDVDFVDCNKECIKLKTNAIKQEEVTDEQLLIDAEAEFKKLQVKAAHLLELANKHNNLHEAEASKSENKAEINKHQINYKNAKHRHETALHELDKLDTALAEARAGNIETLRGLMIEMKIKWVKQRTLQNKNKKKNRSKVNELKKKEMLQEPLTEDEIARLNAAHIETAKKEKIRPKRGKERVASPLL